jgi:hypothetical protein
MNFFNKTLIVAGMLSIVFVIKTNAQMHLSDDIGRPISLTKYEDVQGSQYLSDDWSKGSVKVAATDTKFVDAELKFSDMDNKLYFKGTKGEAMAFTTPVAEFKITISDNGVLADRDFVSGLDGAGDKTYYEVFANGKTKFGKKSVKTIIEKKEYSSATVTKSFDTAERYFIYADGKLNTVKKDKKSILEALSSKRTELETYAKAHNTNFKKDADVGLLVDYYNTLQ